MCGGGGVLNTKWGELNTWGKGLNTEGSLDTVRRLDTQGNGY